MENITTEDIKKYENEIRQYPSNLRFGVRYDDRDFNVGDVVPNSYDWIDNKMTDSQLDGTCVIALEVEDDAVTVPSHCSYPYSNAYLVVGYFVDYGIDRSEMILSDCEVIAKI